MNEEYRLETMMSDVVQYPHNFALKPWPKGKVVNCYWCGKEIDFPYFSIGDHKRERPQCRGEHQ